MLDKYTHISTQKALKTRGFVIPVNIDDWFPSIPNGYSLNSSFLISNKRMTFTTNFNVTKYGGGGPIFVEIQNLVFNEQAQEIKQ